MKIRNGFVSNSSSSSFIVAFPKMPDSKEELKSFLNSDIDISYYDKEPYTQQKFEADVAILWDIISQYKERGYNALESSVMSFFNGNFDLDTLTCRGIDSRNYIEDIDIFEYEKNHSLKELINMPLKEMIQTLFEYKYGKHEGEIICFEFGNSGGDYPELEYKAPELFGKYLIASESHH